MSLGVSTPLLNLPSPHSNSSTPTATTPTPSDPIPPHASSSSHELPSPSSSSSSSLPSPSAPPTTPAPHYPPPALFHQQLASTSFKPPSSRSQRRVSSPSVQLNSTPPDQSSPAHGVLDDIFIGGECGVVNGGTVLGPNHPSASRNWIARHLTVVLQHSFTVSSPHPITSEPHTLHPHYVHADHSKSHFLTFCDPLSPEHLRNKFSIASLSSLTTSTTDEDEDDEPDEVEEADSQDSTASSDSYHNLKQQAPSQPLPLCPSFRSQSSHPHPFSSSSSNSSSSNPQSRFTSPSTTQAPLSSSTPKTSTCRLHLIRILNTWSFDANSLSPAQIRCSLHILLSIYLKYTPDFFPQLEDLGVNDPEKCLRGLVDNLEVAYDSRNAYHNFRHAVDVVQAIYIILSHEGIVPPLAWVLEKESGVNCQSSWRRQPVGKIGHLMDEMSVWALLLAAAGHDVGHPGLSNAFMVNARTPIAHVFSDGAVLENFHRITFTRMLREHGFKNMVDGHAGFRQVLAGAVLATDMGRHFPIVEQLKRLSCDWSQNLENDGGAVLEEQSQKVLIAAGLMKCGDISNSSRPHHISMTWFSCLLTEWSRQAALEADLHLPVSVVTLDPAEKRAQAKSQIGFTSLFVLPLFTVMEELSPTAFRPFADYCRLGLTTWQKVVEQIDSQAPSPRASLAIEPDLQLSTLQSPLLPNSTPSERPIDDPLQDLITRGSNVVDLSFSPLSASPFDSLPSISFSQPPSYPKGHAENHLKLRSKSASHCHY